MKQSSPWTHINSRVPFVHQQRCFLWLSVDDLELYPDQGCQDEQRHDKAKEAAKDLEDLQAHPLGRREHRSGSQGWLELGEFWAKGWICTEKKDMINAMSGFFSVFFFTLITSFMNREFIDTYPGILSDIISASQDKVKINYQSMYWNLESICSCTTLRSTTLVHALSLNKQYTS